ncbi:MAG: glutathione synthase [Clostridia bacterium]|nr:glutathione synthase [Clostridia bacterium]
MLFDLDNTIIKEHIKQAEFGIERESLRINSDGTLAQTPHPFGEHKNIDRDFCENQVEIIGDVFTDPQKLYDQLIELQKYINSKLKENNEFLWPFSNPPKIGSEDDIPVAEYKGSLQSKSVYRHYLAQKYGKIKMLLSGIHLNFSFSDQFIREAFEQSGKDSFTKFKNDIYLKLGARLTQYSWFVVFLTAASPVSDRTCGTESNIYSSIRCSDKGYWNHFVPLLDYSDLDSYIKSIQKYIDNGNLRSVSELYYPVRLKPRGANSLEALAEKGINHLELRVIDVNPLSPTGIFVEDIRFIHLLMIYLVSLPEKDFTYDAQIKAVNNIKQAAVFGNEDTKQRAEIILADIQRFTSKYFPEYISVINYQLEKLNFGNSYAEIISKRFGDDYMEKGLKLAKQYQRSVGDV